MPMYPVFLSPDDNNTVLVTSPFLPEVTTLGESREAALLYADKAIEEALAARKATGQAIPPLPHNNCRLP